MNIISVRNLVISFALVTTGFLLTACPGPAHDYNSGQAEPKPLNQAVMGLWRTDCAADTQTTSKQEELNFLSNGQLNSKTVYFSDLACKTMDGAKTDQASSAGPVRSYSLEGRNGRKGKVVIRSTISTGKTLVETYSAVVLNTAYGEQLGLKLDSTNEREVYYHRVQE